LVSIVPDDNSFSKLSCLATKDWTFSSGTII
jgi:hypothetical protein